MAITPGYESSNTTSNTRLFFLVAGEGCGFLNCLGEWVLSCLGECEICLARPPLLATCSGVGRLWLISSSLLIKSLVGRLIVNTVSESFSLEASVAELFLEWSFNFRACPLLVWWVLLGGTGDATFSEERLRAWLTYPVSFLLNPFGELCSCGWK